MDETRGPTEATGEGDAAMHTLSDGTATLSKWIDESIRFRPYTTLAVAAVLGLALGRVAPLISRQTLPCSIPGSP